MTKAGEKKPDPLQDISAYFLSRQFQDAASAIQTRYPDLFSAKRRITPDSRRPGKKTAAKLEAAGIDLVKDAAMDEALQTYVDSTRRTESVDHSQYDYVLLSLMTVADAHIIPHHTALFADDHVACMGYTQTRPRLAAALATLMEVPEATRDMDAIGFVNGIIDRIDRFDQVVSGMSGTGGVITNINFNKPSSAPKIKKRARLTDIESTDGPIIPTPPATRAI